MSTEKLLKLLQVDNIATELTEEQLQDIGRKVVDEFEIDKSSRTAWDRVNAEALKIAQQLHETKNTPWENASNVKYPLITAGCIMYSAHAYSGLIRDGRLVEFRVLGDDPSGEKEKRAKRLAAHMSYQLLIEDDAWEESQDRLSHVFSLIGHVFKKVYYDPVTRKNCSELCLPDKIFINNNVASLKKARRVTHLVNMYHNDILERIRCGYFIDIPLEDLTKMQSSAMNTGTDSADDPIHEILEQHRYLDLDEDGYAEPYIVTTHKDSGRVLAIYPRFDEDSIKTTDDGKIKKIEAVNYFVDFIFMPAANGTYYGMGLGALLYSLNNSINTILNQLIDSGTLNTLQGGFVTKSFKIKNGALRWKMGEYQPVDFGNTDDISKNFYNIPTKEPSAVLYQLLGMLIDATKELAFVSDVNTGQQDGQNVPATTALILAEKGAKLFNSIQRRVYRALTKEFKVLAYLNKKYLDEQVYFKFQDNPQAIARQDYEDDSLDVTPVADPSMSSDAERLMRAQLLQTLLGQPGIETYEVQHRFLEALGIPNIDKVLPPPDKQSPSPPNPELMKIQMQAQQQQADFELAKIDREIEMRRLALEEARFNFDQQKASYETKMKAAETGAKVEKMHVDSVTALDYASIATKELDHKRAEVNIKQKEAQAKIDAGIVSHSK
jgi:chaperonin GroES